jgi:hypothetical protein
MTIWGWILTILIILVFAVLLILAAFVYGYLRRAYLTRKLTKARIKAESIVTAFKGE